jgi:hypothetical protein
MKTALIVFGLIAAAFIPMLAPGLFKTENGHSLLPGDLVLADNAPRNTARSSRVGVSMAQFSSLKTGMTLEEAIAILGGPGEELSSNDIAGIQTVMYMWKGAGVANMNAMFQNGKLIQKAQFGLK